MKLIGYPTADAPPWPALDPSDREWRDHDDVREEFCDRNINYTEELISLSALAYNLNARRLDLDCAHWPTRKLGEHIKELWRRQYQIAERLNPPIYAAGDELDFRMFPRDEPRRVRITDTYFDLTNGRGYRFTVIGHPEIHIPGARASQLSVPGFRHLDGELTQAQMHRDAAHGAFNQLGKWRDQRSAYQRQAWQRAKLEVCSSERVLHNLNHEKKNLKPGPLLLTFPATALPEPPTVAPQKLCVSYNDPWNDL